MTIDFVQIVCQGFGIFMQNLSNTFFFDLKYRHPISFSSQLTNLFDKLPFTPAQTTTLRAGNEPVESLSFTRILKVALQTFHVTLISVITCQFIAVLLWEHLKTFSFIISKTCKPNISNNTINVS